MFQKGPARFYDNFFLLYCLLLIQTKAQLVPDRPRSIEILAGDTKSDNHSFPSPSTSHLSEHNHPFMVRYTKPFSSSKEMEHPGLAGKATEDCAARRAQHAQYAQHYEGKEVHLSPCCQKRQKKTVVVLPSGSGSINEDEVASLQLIAQSQSLLLPEVRAQSQESVGFSLSAATVQVESQLTTATDDFPENSPGHYSSCDKSSERCQCK